MKLHSEKALRLKNNYNVIFSYKGKIKNDKYLATNREQRFLNFWCKVSLIEFKTYMTFPKHNILLKFRNDQISYVCIVFDVGG